MIRHLAFFLVLGCALFQAPLQSHAGPGPGPGSSSPGNGGSGTDPSLYTTTELHVNLDLGVLGSAWTRQLAIVGNENVDFRWRSSGFSVAKANWELRDGGNNLIAQGQPTSLLDADGYFRFSLDLAPLNVSPPLSISVQPQTAGGLIAAARSNDVELGDLPDVGGRCLTASEQGIPIGGKLESIRQSHSVPALAGAIITKDSFMMLDAVGIRGVYTGVPVTPFDRWHLGSITKSMTSTLAAVLMQKYPASLQPGTTVADAFSSRFWVGSLDPAFASLTLRDLMAHRSGIVNVDSGPWAHMVDSSLSLIQQREQFTRAMGQTPPTNPAGSPFVYRNENFIIAGAMLEAIFGKSWEQLMEEHLFDPLEMNDFGFGTTVLDGNSQPMGHYNNQFGHLLPNQGDNTPSLGPAGTVHMSLADAARYLRLYLNGNEGELALTAATMSELLSPYGGMGQRYNWGWGNSADGFGQVRVGHDGSNTLWYASVLAFPGRGYAFVAASNIATVDVDFTDSDPGDQRGMKAVVEAMEMLYKHHTVCPGTSSSPNRLNGSLIVESAIPEIPDGGDPQLDSASGHVYQLNARNGNLERTNLDGREATVILSGLPDAANLRIDPAGDYLYWLEGGANGAISRARLDGSERVRLLSGLFFPRSLAIDFRRSELYWISERFAKKAELNGENIETIATELPDDAELRIFQAVPEPATPILLAAGVCMLQVLARRSRRAGKPRPLH